MYAKGDGVVQDYVTAVKWPHNKTMPEPSITLAGIALLCGFCVPLDCRNIVLNNAIA